MGKKLLRTLEEAYEVIGNTYPPFKDLSKKINNYSTEQDLFEIDISHNSVYTSAFYILISIDCFDPPYRNEVYN